MTLKGCFQPLSSYSSTVINNPHDEADLENFSNAVRKQTNEITLSISKAKRQNHRQPPLPVVPVPTRLLISSVESNNKQGDGEANSATVCIYSESDNHHITWNSRNRLIKQINRFALKCSDETSFPSPVESFRSALWLQSCAPTRVVNLLYISLGLLQLVISQNDYRRQGKKKKKEKKGQWKWTNVCIGTYK